MTAEAVRRLFNGNTLYMPEPGSEPEHEEAFSSDAAEVSGRASKKPDKPKRPTDPLEALRRWIVTDEQVQDMKATEFIWLQIIARSHLQAWVAPANGGKTTIARFAAGEMAHQHTVMFFQEDASAGDLPALHQHARDHGYALLNSTLAGSSPEEQMQVLRALAKDGADLSNTVMFFDTLKKFTDLMSKGNTRGFFQLMRSLTQRGATVVLLGHTNKHRGVDGKPIFEGVGDVRNDVDELLYLDATEKDSGGMVTLTIRPDKVRCAVQETTFQLNTRTMEIRALDHVVNVSAMVEAKERFDDDRPLIASVRSALSSGGMNYTALLERVIEDTGRSRRTVTKLVDRYMATDPEEPKALWIETRLRTNNARHVSLKPRTDA